MILLNNENFDLVVWMKNRSLLAFVINLHVDGGNGKGDPEQTLN